MVKRIGSLHSLSIYVSLSIAFVILYTISEFVLSIYTGVFHDTLTACVYAFFGTEVGACGFIKIFKLRGSKNDNISG